MTRLAPFIIGGIAVLAVAIAPAGAVAKPAGGGGKTISCRAGALWQDENGKVIAVCNKKGEWVKVVRRTASDGTTQTTLATAQGPVAGAGS